MRCKRKRAARCRRKPGLPAPWRSGRSPPTWRTGRRRPTSVRALLAQEHAGRLEQDDDVLPQRPVAHVVLVETQALLKRQLVPAADLPEPGDAGRRLEDRLGERAHALALRG